MNRIATYYRHAWQPPVTVRLLAIVKRKPRELYVFTWDDDPASRTVMLRTAGRFASNAELSFTWYDAAKLSQMVREAEK